MPKKWKLIKNPNTLHNFGAKCRGVILLNGDLYLENFSNGTIHNDLLNQLYLENIFKEIPQKNWTKKLPQQSGFLTVQRYENTNYICIGESNSLIYDIDEWKKLIINYNKIINKAKAKNPEIQFSNKLVGIKQFKIQDLDSNKENIFNENLF